MRKQILLCAGVALLLGTVMDAAVYKGRKYYKNDCRPCHSMGDELSTSKTQDEWMALMDHNGIALATIHRSNKSAKDSLAYFNGKYYPKKARHLKDFLVEFASDSGNIPACD